MPKKSQRLPGIIVTVSSALLFGIYPPAARAMYAHGANASFTALATVICCTAALYLFCMSTRKKLFSRPGTVSMAFKTGFLQATIILCNFAALTYISAPVMVMIVFSYTLVLLAILTWRKEIRLSPLIIITTLTALLGLSFVMDVWHQTRHIQAAGIIFAALSAFSLALRVYLFGKQKETHHPIVAGAESHVVALLIITLSVGFFPLQFPESASGYGWAIVTCVSQILGVFGMFYGIALLGSFQYSLLAKLEPVFNVLFSLIFINEVLSGSQYAGMAIVLLSLAAYQYMDHKKSKLM